MSNIGIIRYGAVAVAIATSAIGPALAQVSGNACKLYENSNFGGRAHELAANTSSEALGDMDGKTSSVRVARDCILIGYAAQRFEGPTQTWGSGDYSDLPEGWNDRLASVRCMCRL